MPTTMKLISKQTLASASASVTFSSIPAAATDLLLLGSARTSGASVDNVRLRFNGASNDTNHSYRVLIGNGSTASSTNNSYILVSAVSGTGTTSNTFANFEIYIPNYAGSTNKSVSATGVQENNATSANIYVAAGLWSNTAAVTELGLTLLAGQNFAADSSFFLYGITKA